MRSLGSSSPPGGLVLVHLVRGGIGNMNLADEIQAVRKLHPSWSFQTAWDHVMAVRPELEASTAESNRVAAKLAPQKEKEARAKFEHVEAIAKRLMARDRSLTFGVALDRVRLCLPGVSG